MKRTFFFEGIHTGEESVDRLDPRKVHMNSYVYLCPECGEVWARSVADIPGTRWWARHVPCPKHEPKGAFYEIPGSLWFGGERSYDESFPPELLRREVRLHLDHAERFGFFLD